MLTVVLTVIALAVACVIVWIAARRTRIVQRVSGNLSGPVEQMQEQILLTADTAVDRLDGKIAQMEILLAEIDRRSTALVQQTKQQQMNQLQIEQQQQQLVVWLQTQRQNLDKEFQQRQKEFLRAPATSAHSAIPGANIPLTLPTDSEPNRTDSPVRGDFTANPEPRQEPPARSKETKLKKETPVKVSSPQPDKRTAILEMAEQGYAVTDIAQKMGVGKGEVMLLLKLRKKVAT